MCPLGSWESPFIYLEADRARRALGISFNREPPLLIMKAILYYLTFGSLLFATACSDDDDDADIETSEVSVLFVHAVPDASALNVTIEDQQVATNLQYLDHSSYITINASNDRATAVFEVEGESIEQELRFFGEFNSVFISGTPDDIQFFSGVDKTNETFADAVTNTVNFGMRMVNLSPDSGPLSLTTTGILLDAETEDVIFGQVKAYVPYPNAMDLPFNIEVRNTDDEAIFMSDELFEKGKAYTIYVNGLIEGTPEVSLSIVNHTDAIQ